MRKCQQKHKQICEKSIYSFTSNQVSSKQLQAAMIRNGSKVPASNSRIQYIYKVILSLNYQDNRTLLFSSKYKCYIRYFNILLQGNISQELKIQLSQMLSFLLSELTREEYNFIFEIEPPPPPPPPVILRDSGYTFYVIQRITPGRKYFIFKNLPTNLLLEPLTSYTFDLSDPTNLNTKLSFSEAFNTGKMYRGVQYVNTPGTEGAKLILTIYTDLRTYKIFTFNDIDVFNPVKYSWGYSTTGILTHLDNSIVQKIYNYQYLNARQYSSLSVYESSGPKFCINDIIFPTVFLELNQFLYQFTYGTYYFEIAETYASTLLNKGYESYVSFVGDPDKKLTGVVEGTAVMTENVNTGSEKVNDGLYDFYYGRVQMNVYKPLPFRLSAYCRSFGFMGGSGLLEFVDSSVSLINQDSIPLLPVYNKIEKNIFLRFNGDTSIDKRRYGMTRGYYFIDIPSTLPIAFLNSSKEPLFTVLTTPTTETTGPFTSADGNEYLFYTGRIHIFVKGYFQKISISTRTGYSGGYEMLVYNSFYGAQTESIYTVHQNIPGLCAQNQIYFVNNRFICFNDTYQQSQYGLSKGVYTIFNIPKEYPITFLNKNKEDLVVLESMQLNSTLRGTSPDGVIYTFYYGIVRVTVHGDFGFMSMCTLFNGYMGGYKMFVYDTIYDNAISYPDPLSVPEIVSKPSNPAFPDIVGLDNVYIPLNLFLQDTSLTYNELYTYPVIYNDVTVTNKIALNSTLQEPHFKFTMKNGIYMFRCMTHYMTLLNKGNEINIKIRGLLSKKENATDGYSYTFFKGDTIAVYVYGNFGMASIEVLGGPMGNYILCHEDNVLE